MLFPYCKKRWIFTSTSLNNLYLINYLLHNLPHQVKMVEQQELKSYNLLSTHPVMDFDANDPGLKKMWYIVSAFIQSLLDILFSN